MRVTPDSGLQPILTKGEAAWARVRKEAAKTWDNVQRKARTTIQDGKRDKANPWLERTGWQPYLMGLERPNLLASIEEPSINPDKNNKLVEAAI